MGNAVQMVSPRRRSESADYLGKEKPGGKSAKKKAKKKKISEANKLKFRVSHMLATKIKKKFEDGSIPQTGVHAHHHMVTTHLAKDTSLIHKNRRPVRAESISEINLINKKTGATTTSSLNETLAKLREEADSLAPWTEKQKFVLADKSVLQEFNLDGKNDAHNETLLANKLELCLICSFLLGKYHSEGVQRKATVMKSMLTFAKNQSGKLLHRDVLPTLFEVFHVNLFYDEMVADDDNDMSWDTFMTDEFASDPNQYYRKEWSDQIVVYQLAFEILSCPDVMEPKDAATEALMSELLLHGSASEDKSFNPRKKSFLEGIIFIILNQNTDSRERQFAVMLLERSVSFLHMPSKKSRLTADQQRQQTQSLWRVLHVTLMDVRDETSETSARGPVGVKEILTVIEGVVGDSAKGLSFDDSLGFDESYEHEKSISDFFEDAEDTDPRSIDVSMLKLTMHIVTSLHALRVNSLSWYHSELVSLAVKVALADENIAAHILNGLLRRWPWSSQKKQILFLHTLERVLDSVWYQEDVIKALVPRMLRVLARILTAENSMIMKQSLQLFLNEHISTTVWFTHLDAVLPALYPHLQRTAHTHWDTDAVHVADSILTLLKNLNEDAFVDFKSSIDTKTQPKETKTNGSKPDEIEFTSI